jgi:hypothetical protein
MRFSKRGKATKLAIRDTINPNIAKVEDAVDPRRHT